MVGTIEIMAPCFSPTDEQTHHKDLCYTDAQEEEIPFRTSDCNFALPWWGMTGEMQYRVQNISFIIFVCLASVCLPYPYFPDFPWDKAWLSFRTAATLLEANRVKIC